MCALLDETKLVTLGINEKQQYTLVKIMKISSKTTKDVT